MDVFSTRLAAIVRLKIGTGRGLHRRATEETASVLRLCRIPPQPLIEV